MGHADWAAHPHQLGHSRVPTRRGTPQPPRPGDSPCCSACGAAGDSGGRPRSHPWPRRRGCTRALPPGEPPQRPPPLSPPGLHLPGCSAAPAPLRPPGGGARPSAGAAGRAEASRAERGRRRAGLRGAGWCRCPPAGAARAGLTRR